MSTAERRPASPIDYVEQLLRNDVPAENKPYVLARFALAHFGANDGNFGMYALEALNSLHEGNEQGTLQPPLEEVLGEEIEFYVEERGTKNIRPYVNPASAFLLSWALENEVRGMSRG